MKTKKLSTQESRKLTTTGKNAGRVDPFQNTPIRSRFELALIGLQLTLSKWLLKKAFAF